ncbi:MAG: VWA domain-containing protein, partial [Acidobacteriota bacterium]
WPSGHGVAMRVRAIGSVVAFVLLSCGLLAQNQGDRPVFRGGVELVQIDVSVLDGKRVPVKGLTAEDFTILENGVPRPIKAFSAITLPPAPQQVEAAWSASVPPDVATNEVGEQDGRLVIILMDRSIPPGQPTVAARKIATAAIDALGPHDLAAVVSTSGGVPQTFTSDHARLRKALAYDFSTDVSQDAKELLASLDPGLAVDRLSDGRCLCGLCVLDTVTRLADAVRGATARRKTLFFIGSSLIVQAPLRDPSADVGCDRLLRDARTKMFDALALSSLTIHSLDPNGVVNISPATRASSPLRGRQVAEVQQAETNEFIANQESLGILPDRTGGRRVINTNAPEEKVPEIFRESESYYVLAFEPGPSGRGDAPRSIEVKVARKGLRVYTQRQVPPASSRNGSSAASGTPPTLDAAVGGLLPVAVRPLRMTVVALAGLDETRAAVAVHVDALSFLSGTGTSAPLEVAIKAIDRVGRTVAAARQTSTLSALLGGAASHPIEAAIESRLALAPGDYEIRVAVRDPSSGVVASVFGPVIVPSFATAPLSLSDITMTTGTTNAVTTRRAFASSDQLQATMQVYEALGRDEDIVAVSIKARIVDATGRGVSDQTMNLTERDFTRRRAACRIAVPIDRLPAGAYLLSLEATAGKETATRTVKFTVQ